MTLRTYGYASHRVQRDAAKVFSVDELSGYAPAPELWRIAHTFPMIVIKTSPGRTVLSAL